jgi:hypothetical protein
MLTITDPRQPGAGVWPSPGHRRVSGNRALIVLVGALLAACRSASPAVEIPRDRAVAIARRELTFEPSSTQVRKTESGSRPVWRVEFRGRLPGQPPMLFETRVIEVDRITGAIVSVTRS